LGIVAAGCRSPAAPESNRHAGGLAAPAKAAAQEPATTGGWLPCIGKIRFFSMVAPGWRFEWFTNSCGEVFVQVTDPSGNSWIERDARSWPQ
jgi:hypothetical protein